jgi:hypothetical protein
MSELPVDHRRRELAQIHIAKKDLAMDEDAYRAVITVGSFIDFCRHVPARGGRA